MSTKPACKGEAGRRMGWFAVAMLPFLLAMPVEAAKIGLNPLMGDGAPGTNTVISGFNFEASASYTVTLGGRGVTPASVISDASGNIAATTLVLPALPAGFHDVVLTSVTRTYTFTGAYRVWRNICLSPAQGDGRAGRTWKTNGAIPAGGWVGMVFRIEGIGFAARASIAANSITVGGSTTTHAAITVGADGTFGSATIIVDSNLANGRKDIVLNDGVATTFAGVYEVRRSIGLNPSMGSQDAGSSITVSGWGFVDGTTGANSTLVGGNTTTHPSATITNGAFVFTLTLDSKSGAKNDVEISGQEVFTTAYSGVKANMPRLAVSPIVFVGVPNQAFLMEGLANWNAGTIGADTTILAANTDVPTVHSAISASGGTFPATWVRLDGGQPADADTLEIDDPGGGKAITNKCITVKGSLGICPPVSNGAVGYSVSLTGFGFKRGANIAADSIAFGSAAAIHAGVKASDWGDLGPLILSLPALANGDHNIVIDDGVTVRTFNNLYHARRSIGLSFIVGPGSAGEVTNLIGTGFTSGSAIPANSITFGAFGVTHAAIAVAADGSFPAEALTLPVLDAGPYDVTAQEVFPQAYRVYNPLVEVGNFSTPTAGVAGTVVTYTFSFTNTGYEGDPPAVSFVLTDMIPAGMQDVAGSDTSSLPATVEWYDGTCPCWTGVEPAPTDVQRIRWTLTSPLPSGASGYASFQVTAL